MSDLAQETLLKLAEDKANNLENFLLEIFGDEEKARVIGAYYTLEEKTDFTDVSKDGEYPHLVVTLHARLSLRSEQELAIAGITDPVHVTWQRYLENGE